MTSYNPETWGRMDRPWPHPDPTNAEIQRLTLALAEYQARTERTIAAQQAEIEHLRAIIQAVRETHDELAR